MKPGKLLGIAAGAIVIGFFLGVILSGDENVSVAAWVGAAALVVVLAMVRELLVASRVEFTPLTPAWRRSDREADAQSPLDYEGLRASVASGLARPQSFNQSLRPRLVELADYYMPRRYGIDVDESASRLGDVGWVIDPNVTDRTPTRDELDRFLNVVIGEDNAP